MRKKTKKYIDYVIKDTIRVILDELDSAGKALSTRITRLELNKNGISRT